MKDTPRRGFLASLGMTVMWCAVAAFSPTRAQHSLAFARDKAAPLQQETAAKQAGAQQQETTANKAGEALYQQRCAACHDNGVPRAPNRAALKEMSAENIRFALVSGKMVVQAFGLSSSQIADLTEFLTGKQPAKEQFSPEAFCPAASGAASFADPLAKPHWNGWGGNLEQHRFQPAEMAQLSADQVPKLKLKWAFGFPGVTRAFGQATVAGGRVFVGSSERKVFAERGDGMHLLGV